MKLSTKTLLGLALIQALSATAFGQDLKNQSAYEKWKAEHPELANSGSKPTTPTPPTTEPKPPKPPKPTTTDTSTPTVVTGSSSGQDIGPSRRIKSEKENQELFSKYCIGDASSAAVPTPNYQNSEVARASRILSKVADVNFYFYADIKNIYKDAGAAPSGVSKNAHLFLTQACGEFRDRAEMVAGKIRWVNNMIMLRDEDQKKNVDYQANIWTQLSGKSYMNYLQVSNSVFTARAHLAGKNDGIKLKLHHDAQEPVPGFTVCETKFIIGEYVAKDRSFSSLDKYESELKSFTANCTQDDKDYYYNFRGDSNFKHYSPESNAMLWHAISIARFCSSPTKANGKNPQITDSVCENYFKKPFLTRYKAAKSGLGAWLLYGKQEEQTFGFAQANVTVIPSFDFNEVGYKPFRMVIQNSQPISISKLIGSSTLNFEEMFQIGTSSAKLGSAYERLRNAVNRHTNWYASSYNDGLGHEKSLRSQAYSPFVASSYEMSMSNGFTECGITIQCDGDGRKAWMLVFKIHKNNWYTTKSLLNNQKVDFDRMWIDETSFGTDPLADRERAWDRLGTALEHELDSILYLHNLEAGSGRPVANDSLGD